MQAVEQFRRLYYVYILALVLGLLAALASSYLVNFAIVFVLTIVLVDFRSRLKRVEGKPAQG